MWNGDRIMSALGLGYDSRAIANEILENARVKGRALTIMQLVKLIYFAHGWYLGFTGRALTLDKPQAWQYGPVYPTVYKAFRNAGSTPISGLIINKATGEPYSANLEDEQESFIDWIVDKYGAVHAFDLSQATHAPGGPWKTVVDSIGYYGEIPDNLMRAYFKRFTEGNEVAR